MRPVCERIRCLEVRRPTGQIGALGLAGLAVAVACLSIGEIACAADIDATVLNQSGKPLMDAVVTVESGDPSTHIPSDDILSGSIIDQKDEMFVPIVAVIRPGGSVTFHNSDRTRHHVYSFSETHPFELVLKSGESSAPVTVDKPGIVAIGCNIHDYMYAFIYVTNAPKAAITDVKGHAQIHDLPTGNFIIKVWHPFAPKNSQDLSKTISLEKPETKLNVTITVSPPPPHDPNSLY